MHKKSYLTAVMLTFVVVLLQHDVFSKPSVLRVPNTKRVQKKEKPHVMTDSQKDIYQWFRTYSEVVSIVEKKAFRGVNFSEFIQGSLKAAASAIDAHSSFLPKDSYSSTIESTSGEFSGIGISVMSKTIEDDGLMIIEVIQSGPSQKAGIRAGDKIVEIDGKKLKGLSGDESVALLKGKVGSQVVIKVLRNKAPKEFKIKRDLIKNQNSTAFFFKKQNVYYYSLKTFSENIATDLEGLLRKANDGGCKGVIIDLRNNPGGVLEAAIEVAGLFLDKKSLVAVTKDRDHNVVNQYFTASNPVLSKDLPIIILVNNFTASASEILAGALRYHSQMSYEKQKQKTRKLMVFLIGTQSFGKGSVQEVMPISNGCALKLTTMLYYLPGDVSIQATGIEPDFTINPKFVPTDEIKWVSDMFGKESSLKNHITGNEARGIKTPAKAAEEKKAEPSQEGEENKDDTPQTPEAFEKKQKEALSQDVQIQGAINVITLIDLARKCDPRRVSTRKDALDYIREHFVTDDPLEIEKIQ